MRTSFDKGSLLGRYRVVSPLGAGGMGEVYLARDEKLDRHVAIKILSGEFTQSADRLRRFEQEARAAAKLNHPAIAHVYEVGEADGLHFIVMEYIEGETLNAAIHRERIELPRLLKYLCEVAEGLSKAHAAGVVHRDLKPDNVMIARDGYAKILDFGLAKLIEPQNALVAGESSEASTALLEQHSTPGMVMGTVGYMSPEQAQGKVREIDHRTDIFSFGCLLYEAATGRRPFEGDTLIKSLHKLVYEPAPPITEFNPHAPPELQRIIRRCLAKDPEERYQSIKDVAIELRELRRELESVEGSERTVSPESSQQTVADQQKTLSSRASAARTGEVVGAGTASNVGRETVVGAHFHRRIAIAAVLAFIAVASAALGIYLYRAQGGETIDSVAVLPLTNATGDPNTDWLADGLTESVIYKLSQMPNLKVIARSTVFRYKGRDVDAAQAARELGVRAILTGRVTQRGDDLTVSAELIDTREGKLLWGERYERKLSDANAVQQEIARAVSDRLRPKMSGEERGQMAKTGTSNPEAYQLYLKGRFYWNKRTVGDINKSIEYFNQAIDKDPTFALAYAALADSYSILPDYDQAAPQAEDNQKARAAANKALEIDNSLAEAHAALGEVKFYEWKFADSEKEFRTAIRLNPNYPTTHQWYAECLSSMGRHEEAIAEIKKAQELDPLSLIINTTVGVSYQKAGQLDQAIEQLRKTIEMDQNFVRAHGQLGFEYEQKRMFDEAMTEYEKADLLSGTQPPEQVTKEFAERRAAYKLTGWKGVWQKDLEIASRDKPDYATPGFLASRYALLGEKDKAFEYLEKAYQAHDINLIYLKVNPDWDNLRDDPRFADLLRRIGLPQ